MTPRRPPAAETAAQHSPQPAGQRDDQVDRVTDAQWEAVTANLLSKIAQSGDRRVYRAVMDDLDAATRATVEEAVERYAARQRRNGIPGW